MLGRPVEQTTGLFHPSIQTFHLTVGGPKTLLIGYDLDLDAHDLCNKRRGVLNGNLEIRTNVSSLADASVAFHSFDETLRGVVHECEVSRWAERAQFDLALSGSDLANDRRDYRAGGLAGPIGVKRTQYCHRRAKALVKGQCQLVRGHLCGGVGRLSVDRMFLCDWHELRGAIGFRRRCRNHPLSTHTPSRLQYVQSAGDVGRHVAVRRVVAEGDGNQRRQVEYRVAAFHCASYAMRIADVSCHHFEVAFHILGRAVEPAPGVQRIVHNKGAHFVAFSNQCLG